MSGGNWIVMSLLSFFAILLLPRMFHVGVVENHTTTELVAALDSRNGWTRDAASRLIYQRGEAATVPMLKAQIDKTTKMDASPDLIRRALKRLRWRYKRPRFVLSRRSPTWRQAKGG